MEITKKMLKELYINKDMGIKKISNYLGVGVRVIRTRLDRFNILKRPFHQKGRGNRLGVILSEDTKSKISKSHTGKALTEEHKESISYGLGSKRMWISNGYVFVREPLHPRADRGRVKRANLVLEKKIGRYLKDGELAHHMNHIRDDDRPENLMLVTRNQHSSMTAKDRWNNGEMYKYCNRNKKGVTLWQTQMLAQD